MTNYTDMMGKPIEVGGTIAAAFREQNVAVLRVGIVTALKEDYEPNVIRKQFTKKVPVVWAEWFTTTHDYLPQRATKIAARKCLVVPQ